jgi:glycerol-3-phosphate dehydrogenase
MVHYDAVVIGAGIHGAGVAQALAARGYRVLVLEQNQPAFGSSSRSSKLIHGGLRYLETAQFALVHECLQERTRLLKLAPDLVELKPFHIPIYGDTTRSSATILAGLSLYALLGQFARGTGFHRVGKRHWSRLDGLQTGGLKSVFCYHDAQTDDRLLTRAVLNSAQEMGAEVQCPARFSRAQVAGRGVTLRYLYQGQEHECRSSVLVNAGGPWVNEVVGKIQPRPAAMAFDWVQGTHLILESRVNAGLYYLEAPQDRRAVFVMPWYGKLMIGTTESHYQGDPAQVRPLDTEVDYLRQVLAHYFPDKGDAPLVEAFAGLRVLPKEEGAAFARPRDTRLLMNEETNGRVLSIYGGKLTTYRLTAERVVQRLAAVLPPARRQGDTREIRLHRPQD